MDNKSFFEDFDKGFNEGYFMAAQQVASVVIRLVNNHPSWMLEPNRVRAISEIKIATKHLLSHRGLIPTSYDVIIGKSEPVLVDFECYETN